MEKGRRSRSKRQKPATSRCKSGIYGTTTVISGEAATVTKKETTVNEKKPTVAKRRQSLRKRRMTGVREVDLMDLDSLNKMTSSSLISPADDFLDFTTTCTPPDTNCDSTPTTSFLPLPPSSSTSSSISSDSLFLCAGCGFSIQDRFVLKVNDDAFHESCLRCAACNIPLSASGTCFAKDGRIYCREDHASIFGRKCGRCSQQLQPSDLVFRCALTTYHQSCFCCVMCGVNFKKGDEYHTVNDEPICLVDYQLLCSQQRAMHIPPSALYDFDLSESNRKTPKRPRTILNAQQRRQFKSAFERSPKPCRKVREQLAKETGLSVRVVQVWFQNQRAKMKKQQRKEEKNGGPDGIKGEVKSESEDDDDSDGEDLENGSDKSRLMTSSLEFKDHSFDGFPQPPPFDHNLQQLQLLQPDSASLQSGLLQQQPSVAPLEKLYNMQHTYFSFA